MTAFHLTTEPAEGGHHGGRVVAVHGDLDVATVPELRSTLADVVAADSDCVLTLAACTFIDSSATRAIAIAADQFADAGLRLILHCPPSNTTVRFVIDLVGLAEIVTVEPGDGTP